MTPRQEEKAIPCEMVMLACSRRPDAVSPKTFVSVDGSPLPNPLGQPGGALAAEFLESMLHHHAVASQSTEPSSPLVSNQNLLLRMRQSLQAQGAGDPQLLSSRKIKLDDPFFIVPKEYKGTKRALLVGINYAGQTGQLTACHRRLLAVKEYLIKYEKFREEHITVLMDEKGQPFFPKRINIITSFRQLVTKSKKGDAVFVLYCGHGGPISSASEQKTTKTAELGNQALVPVDASTAGLVRDKEIYSTLVRSMPAGTHLTWVMDCCHGGSVIRLPYETKLERDGENMMYAVARDPEFSVAAILGLAAVGGLVAYTAGGGDGDGGGVEGTGTAGYEAGTDVASGDEGCCDDCCCCDALFSEIFN